MNKNFGGWTDLGKKRHGSADLHTPIQPPQFWKVGERKNKIYAIGSFLRCGIMWTWNVIDGCYMNLYKQSEMLFRTLANMLLRLLVWFLLFQTTLGILNDFEIFDPFNIFTSLLRYSLLVTRYFVTRYSLLRYSLLVASLLRYFVTLFNHARSFEELKFQRL